MRKNQDGVSSKKNERKNTVTFVLDVQLMLLGCLLAVLKEKTKEISI